MQTVETLENLLPDVPLRIPFMLGVRQAVTASGQRFTVTERTVPLGLAFTTSWGAGAIASNLVCDHAAVG